jgi:hypothetical protein
VAPERECVVPGGRGLWGRRRGPWKPEPADRLEPTPAASGSPGIASSFSRHSAAHNSPHAPT